MNKDGFLNPIQPDIKKGKYRVVKPFFPYSGYLWNYGYLPQTWESPFEIHPTLKVKGDNDPIDVCEIGSKLTKVGDVKQVKLLGGLAMLDEGERY
jgi:inorganic pyrophosphatase